MQMRKANRERRNRWKRMLRTAPARGKHEKDKRRGPEGLWCQICSPWYSGPAHKHTNGGRAAAQEGEL